MTYEEHCREFGITEGKDGKGQPCLLFDPNKAGFQDLTKALQLRRAEGTTGRLSFVSSADRKVEQAAKKKVTKKKAKKKAKARG